MGCAVSSEKEGFPVCVWVGVYVRLCVNPPPSLVSASAVSLTHPTANQITERGEETDDGGSHAGDGAFPQ